MFKYKKKSIIALLIAAILCVSGCGSSQSSTTQTESSESAEYSLEEMFSDRDFEIGYDEAGSTVINLESTVTISEEGTYILKGSLSDGMVIVDADKSDKIQIVLDNVDISSSTSAAIYVKQADKVFITLAADSENILSNGGEFVAIDDNNIDAVIFSKDDITINGNGSLTIKSPAGHGIVSKDDLKITSGEYTIDSMKDGLSGKDSVKIANGTINISSKGDGISSEGIVYIEDGVFDIITGGGSENAKMKTGMDDMMNRPGGMRGGKNENMSEGDNRMPAGELANPKELNTDYSVSDDEASDTTSTKGIKAEELLMINGGTFNLECVDDGIHSNTDVMINGGSFTIKTGDDGIHGENELTVSGGSIDISKCYEGLEADNLTIANGNISVVSNDDGINAASAINIKGGTIDVTSTGDCIDSNGDCFVSGGTITLNNSSVGGGEGILDFDGDSSITGGVLMAVGPYEGAINFGSSSTQGSMVVSVGQQSENTEVKLLDSDGNEVVSYTPKVAFSGLVISSPNIKSGNTYKVVVGDEETEVKMDSLIYGGNSGNMMGGPGNKGMKNH